MTTPGFNVFNDQIFNTVTILNAIIIKGSLVTVGGIVFQNVPGNDLNVDLDRYFNNANAASIRFRTFIPGAPGAPVNDWVIGTIAGSYEFSIVQSTNATGASANMNITLNNAILVVTGQMRLTRSTAADQFFDIDRLNNTVNDFIRFTRASSSTVDWNIGTTAGGSVLAISQGAGGVNRDMTISLTDGLATTGTLILTGKLTAQTLSAKEYLGVSGATVGSGKITAGSKSVVINSTLVKENSRVLITPTVETSQTISVTNKSYITDPSNATSPNFTVSVPSVTTADISFDWFIVNETN